MRIAGIEKGSIICCRRCLEERPSNRKHQRMCRACTALEVKEGALARKAKKVAA